MPAVSRIRVTVNLDAVADLTIELDELAERYETALRAAFPGARVTVATQDATGWTPEPQAWERDDDGDELPCYSARVMDRVYDTINEAWSAAAEAPAET